MAKRRTSGEGTIYKTERGKFRAQIVVNGRRKSKTAVTAKECRTWLADQRKSALLGGSMGNGDRPVHQALDEWIAGKRGSVRLSTYTLYSALFENHIKPIFGNVTLGDVTPAVVQAAIDAHVHQDSWTKHIRLGFTTFRNVLDRYVNVGSIDFNPFDRVDIYPASKEVKDNDILEVWTANQVLLYVETVEAHRYTRPANALKFAVGTALRIGELAGLTWQNVDLDNGVIHIVQQLMAKEKGVSPKFGPLKSAASKRTLRIGDYLVDVLRKQLEQVEVSRATSGREWTEYDVVFPSRGGLPFSRTGLRHAHYEAIKRAGLPRIRFHDLRHTAISLMLQRNVPVTEVSRYAGHANVGVTLRVYSHYIPTQESKAAMVMDDILRV